MASQARNTFTVSNIAGGDLRRFRLVNGEISGAAIRHARSIGFGGPQFSGPAGEEASTQYERIEEESADA